MLIDGECFFGLSLFLSEDFFFGGCLWLSRFISLLSYHITVLNKGTYIAVMFPH